MSAGEPTPLFNLTGRVAIEHLTVQELDRIVGVLFELTERWFQAAVTIAYK